MKSDSEAEPTPSPRAPPNAVKQSPATFIPSIFDKIYRLVLDDIKNAIIEEAVTNRLILYLGRTTWHNAQWTSSTRCWPSPMTRGILDGYVRCWSRVMRCLLLGLFGRCLVRTALLLFSLCSFLLCGCIGWLDVCFEDILPFCRGEAVGRAS